MSNIKENPVKAIVSIQKRKIGKLETNSVDARKLHAFLLIKTTFRDWIARRVDQYGFSEGVDFRSFLSETSNGRPSREYYISLDMAKELCMVERTEKGRQARQYFIECERQLFQKNQNQIKQQAKIAPPLKTNPEPDQKQISELKSLVKHYRDAVSHLRADRDFYRNIAQTNFKTALAG